MKQQQTKAPLIRELVRSFDSLRSLHEQLFQVLDDKIVAMREARMENLHRIQSDETTLLRALREKESQRAVLMQACARDCGVKAGSLKSATVSRIAAAIPATERELLTSSASKLQAAIAKTAQANRVAGMIARQVSAHMKHVFAAVRPGSAGPVGYTRSGESFVAEQALVDMVG